MKKTKVLLTLVCAILLVASSVLGTMAYLTSTDKVGTPSLSVMPSLSLSMRLRPMQTVRLLPLLRELRPTLTS